MTNSPMRVAVYARYSSDMQSLTSVEDQVRPCRNICDAQGWPVTEVFSDEAISGKTERRPGFERLRAMVADGHFDVFLTEILTMSPQPQGQAMFSGLMTCSTRGRNKSILAVKCHSFQMLILGWQLRLLPNRSGTQRLVLRLKAKGSPALALLLHIEDVVR